MVKTLEMNWNQFHSALFWYLKKIIKGHKNLPRFQGWNYFVFLILHESNSSKCFLILFAFEDLLSLAKITTLNSSNCEAILIIPHATSEFQSSMDCHLNNPPTYFITITLWPYLGITPHVGALRILKVSISTWSITMYKGVATY